MPLGKTHQVLCAACCQAVTTEYAYPERRCGYTTAVQRERGGKLIHVSCTNSETSKDCKAGEHFDRYVQLGFASPGRLSASSDGQVRRA